MILTALIFASCQSTAVPPLVQQERGNRTREAQQALTAGDFERAEKLALGVMQGAEPEDQPRWAWKIYAECRFRGSGYKDAINYFRLAVRPNSDERVNAMLAISALKLGYLNGMSSLAHLGVPEIAAKELKVDPTSLPDLHAKGTGTQYAYSWLMLAAFSKSNDTAVEDAKTAATFAPNNVAIQWVKGRLFFDLGKYKEAKAEFERVAKSKFESMSEAAKLRVAECDDKIRGG